METVDGVRLKLFELPFIRLGEAAIDLAPMIMLILLFIAAISAMVYAKKKEKWRMLIQGLSLFMFVFAAHQTMCVLRTWIFGFQEIGIDDTLAFFLLHIAVTLIFMSIIAGAAFCGWICPVGTIQDIINYFSFRGKQRFTHKSVFLFDITLSIVTILLLGWLSLIYAPADFFFSDNVAILFTIAGLCGLPFILMTPWIDKKFRLFRYVSLWGRIIIILIGIHVTNPGCTVFEMEVDYSANISFVGVVLVAAVISRAYCKYICPFGAVFGFFAPKALLKVKSKELPCTIDCGKCSVRCVSGALDNGKVDYSCCSFCGRCVDNCTHEVVLDVGDISEVDE
jgi:polyferredoxin